jgi:hypothetical protein
MILREAGTFAYNQGLIFEGELLHAGGKKMAFAGAFARPPRNSHEVLQPQAYIQNQKLAPVYIPDMKEALGNQYDVYDSGGIGELDVRALLKQYGERKIADDLAASWQGGAFVAFRRKDKAAEVSASTGDLALLYVSRWKTPQSAERFARFYAGAVAQRYHSATAQTVEGCSGASCPISVAQIATEEGPVIVEHWDDNSVVVSESFDTATAAKLHTALRDDKGATRAASAPQEEIGLRLLEIPAFQAFAREIGERLAEEMSRAAGR